MMDEVKALEALRNDLRSDHPNTDQVEYGDFTYGHPMIFSWGEGAKCQIGKYCSIGANVQIYLGGNHHTDWFTTYPFNALLPEIWGDIDGGVAATKGDVVIGNGVWIGNNVTILSGVKIGNGAVIGAGSVVTKDVDDFVMVAGNPARAQKFLWEAGFAGTEKWWDWPIEKIAHGARVLMGNDTDAMTAFMIMYEKKVNGDG